MQVKIDGKRIELAASRVDDIRAAYSETEHIAFPENQIRLVFRKSDAPETPTQATEQE